MAKYKIIINNIDNLRDLLQQTYDLTEMQITQAQNEINKLANSVQLQDEILDSKSKYAKAINDYLKIKDNAISRKLDIARILTEVCKFNGDVGKALNDGNMQQNMTFDFSKIRSIVDGKSNKSEGVEKIELGKK